MPRSVPGRVASQPGAGSWRCLRWLQALRFVTRVAGRGSVVEAPDPASPGEGVAVASKGTYPADRASSAGLEKPKPCMSSIAQRSSPTGSPAQQLWTAAPRTAVPHRSSAPHVGIRSCTPGNAPGSLTPRSCRSETQVGIAGRNCRSELQGGDERGEESSQGTLNASHTTKACQLVNNVASAPSRPPPKCGDTRTCGRSRARRTAMTAASTTAISYSAPRGRGIHPERGADREVAGEVAGEVALV